jgi:hypothetical protein
VRIKCIKKVKVLVNGEETADDPAEEPADAFQGMTYIPTYPESHFEQPTIAFQSTKWVIQQGCPYVYDTETDTDDEESDDDSDNDDEVVEDSPEKKKLIAREELINRVLGKIKTLLTTKKPCYLQTVPDELDIILAKDPVPRDEESYDFNHVHPDFTWEEVTKMLEECDKLSRDPTRDYTEIIELYKIQEHWAKISDIFDDLTVMGGGLAEKYFPKNFEDSTPNTLMEKTEETLINEESEANDLTKVNPITNEIEIEIETFESLDELVIEIDTIENLEESPQAPLEVTISDLELTDDLLLDHLDFPLEKTSFELRERESMTLVTPHYKKYEDPPKFLMPIYQESRKLRRTKKILPLRNFTFLSKNNAKSEEHKNFKQARAAGRKQQIKINKRKKSKGISRDLETVIELETYAPTNSVAIFKEKIYSVDQSTIETSKPEKLEIVKPKNHPNRTVNVKRNQAAQPAPDRTVTSDTNPRRSAQSPKIKQPVETSPNSPPVPTMSIVKIILATISVPLGIYILISMGINLKQLFDKIQDTPFRNTTVTYSSQNFTFSREEELERVKRSSPIMSIGLDSSKLRDPSRWSLSTEDIGNIAQKKAPEGTTTKSLQFVGSITVFEQLQSLGASEAQMKNAMKYLV